MVKIRYIIISYLLIGALSAQDQRACIVDEGEKLLGVRELTSNDSPEIRTILANAGFDRPVPYCSATLKWLFDICKVMNHTITAWSPTAVPDELAVWKGGQTITRDPLPADVWGIYSPRKGRIAHVGIVLHWPKNSPYFLTLEGNANVGDGTQGITVLRRKKSQMHIIVDWIGNQPELKEQIEDANNELNDSLDISVLPDTVIIQVPEKPSASPAIGKSNTNNIVLVIVGAILLLVIIDMVLRRKA